MNIRNMSDRQLSEITNDINHPRYDDAIEEEEYRNSLMNDPRVAQAMGEEFYDWA